MTDNKKYLLREFYKLCDGGICKDLLTEQEKLDVKNGAMILSGIAQRADFKNGNGRIYPYDVLAREVENYKKVVRERRSLGQLDHPEESVIELEHSSHLITDIWMENKDVFVKLKILSGVPGQQLRSLVNDGVAIGLSSRGLGSIKDKKEGLVVDDDFSLICFDVVAEPSTQGAFMRLNESKNLNVSSKGDRINRSLWSILNK